MTNPMAQQECCNQLHAVEFFENGQWHIAAFGDGSLMVFNQSDQAKEIMEKLVKNSKVQPLDTRVTTWNRQTNFQFN